MDVKSVVILLFQVQEVVKTGKWVGDCFIYTNSVNRLNYYVGGEIVTIAHLDRYGGWYLRLLKFDEIFVFYSSDLRHVHIRLYLFFSCHCF